MKNQSSKKITNQSLISLLILFIFIFLALASTSLFGLLGIPLRTTSTFNDQTNEYTVQYFGFKDDESDTTWIQTVKTHKDYYGNWKGETTISNFNSHYDEDEEKYFCKWSKETVNYIGGRRDGKSITKYRSYIRYKGDDNYYNETYSFDTVCYDFGNRIPCSQLKNAFLNKLDVTAFETLLNNYPWFIGTLNVLGFSNQYVEEYMDTLEVLINTESFEFNEFDSYFDDAIDELEETPFDSLVQISKMLNSVYGLELMKDIEFRMAVIDHHRDKTTSTFQFLQSDYPHYLTSFDNDSVVVQDSEWEAFCSKFDDLMNSFSPLDISDPFLTDSVDARMFNILLYISQEESDSTKSANIKSILNEIKPKMHRLNISSVINDHKTNLLQEQAQSITPKTLATNILLSMIRKYLFEGDVPRLAAKEAYAKQQNVVHVANVTTKLAGKVAENKFEILGNVLTDGGAPVTERGLAWAKYNSPTVDDNIIKVGEGIGGFTSTFQITDDSNYYLRAFAENSAGIAYGNCIVINNNTLVGLNEFKSKNVNFMLYPNPAKNEVHFEFNIYKTENISVTITNLSGTTVFKKQIKNMQPGINNITVNTSGFQNGIYLCRIDVDGIQLQSKKLVIDY